MATKKVSDTSFDADVLKAKGPVLVDFWAEWCGPCKQIGPFLEEIAVEMAEKLKPEVVVMDVSMPELNGIEATRRLAKSLPYTRVLALSMHKDSVYVREILRAGARGYLLKDSSDQDLIAAVRSLAKGEGYISPAVSSAVLADTSSRSAGPRTERTCTSTSRTPARACPTTRAPTSSIRFSRRRPSASVQGSGSRSAMRSFEASEASFAFCAPSAASGRRSG